jgi:Na+/melibiose symporter-like transporter
MLGRQHNAQLSMVGSLSESAAFAAGGWLYQALGAAFALTIDALSYLGSGWLLRGVREAPIVDVPLARIESRWTRWRREQREGWRTVLEHASLRLLPSIDALRCFGAGLAGMSHVVYVERDLALPTGIQGMVFAPGGLGSVAGAVMVPRLGARAGAGRAMGFGLALTGVGAACVPLAADAGAVAIALLVAHQIVGDGGMTINDVHDRALRQTAVGPAFLARVDAGLRGIEYLATLLRAAVGGLLGTLASARGCAR